MDPLGGMRSSMAQGKSMSKGVKSKMKMAKAANAKAAKFDKAVIFYLLSFLAIGVLLGCTVFFPYYGGMEGSMVKMLYVLFILTAGVLGRWHMIRMYKKVDWANEYRFGPEFTLTVGSALFLGLGVFLVQFFIPRMIPSWSLVGDFAFLLASAFVAFVIPFLLSHLFEAAQSIEEDIYPLWYYPKNYIEKQPTWNRELVVYANMVFYPKPSEDRPKRIEVRLPEEANLGEILYLFINDYNKNKSPDRPISDLRREDNSLGWLFSVPKKLWKIQIGKRYLDPELTIEENQISKQMDISFERVISEQN